jgi:signal transduction histidine kinase
LTARDYLVTRTMNPMSAARQGRGGWIVIMVIAGLVLAAGSVGVSAWVTARDHRPLATAALVWAAFLGFAVIGAVVALARPGNRVGWLMLSSGTLSLLGGAGIDVADHDLLRGGGIPGGSAFAVIGGDARSAGWYLAAIWVALYFPDGRAVTGRWRWLPGLAIVGLIAGLLGSTFATHAQLNELSRWHNPLSSHALNAIADPLSGFSLLINVLVTVAAVARLVSRWRHGEPLERQQIGLFAAVAVLPIFAVILGVTGVTGAAMFGLMLLPLPIGIGFAVLARGLYDLATAANRTLVWLTLSAAVVGIYALVIAGVGSTLRATGASWLPWVAAAVVAISFAPLRDVLQRGINRLTFGRWDDPYRVLATLGQHLEASADVDGLLADVVAELKATLGLRHVAVVAEDSTVLAGVASNQAPEAVEAGEAVPLVAYGRSIGTLRYQAPAPLRPGDRRLLGDVAGHVAGLLHAYGLTRDLQRARERLVLAREEERRRLRRDLHDGLGPALAGHLLRLELIGRGLPPDSAERPALDALRDDVQATIADVRRVVEGLRPPAIDEIGLAAAIDQAVQRLVSGTTVRCSVVVGRLAALSAASEVAAYRIVSEAVTNVVRHSGARSCQVCLDVAEGALRITVTDDGRGVADGSTRGNGLETMRERAEELGGHLTVTSSGGTTVCAELPVGSPQSLAVEVRR